jgi:hypothetical protein
MDLQTYRILHVTGLMLVFLGLGGILLRPADGNPRVAMLLHGIGMLLLLVAGFGMLAKRDLGFEGWVIAKLGIWVFLGVLPVLVKKRILSSFLAWVCAVGVGVTAVWLVLEKPWT